MENNTYLITLTPAGNYYFGSERGFNEKSLTGKGFEKNYLVKGFKYPQQTTLLGLLRFELLKNANLLAPKHTTDNAKKLVGEKGGFDGTEKEYGIIKSISPVFLKLQSGNETTFVLPVGKLFQGGKELTIHEKEDIINGPGAVLSGYDSKQYLVDESEFVIPGKNGLESIFGKSQQIGIKKNYKGKTDDEAFFKQTFCYLRKNHKKQRYAFAFYASFNRKLKDGDLKNGIAYMGGDQSIFKLEVTPAEDNNTAETLYNKIDKQNNTFIANAVGQDNYKITLLSDARIERNLYKDAIIGITEVTNFRHIQTKQTTTRFAYVSEKNTDLIKSGKQELIARGSVFFVKGKYLQHFCKSLKESSPAYSTIGYNHFQISK